MSRQREDIQERDLQGFRYCKKVSALLNRLHGAACERDRAHNRDLHMDQYMVLLLLYMFKPTVRTYEMLNWRFLGWADEAELASRLARLHKQD